MKKIVINGGKSLYGSIFASGSKNAALPILFATLITHGVSRISRLPDIGDVRCTLDILRSLGAEISRVGDSVLVDTENLFYTPPSREAVCRIRASTYLIGACLSRFGRCDIPAFGGCNFSERPIDLHIMAAETLGAALDGGTLTSKGLFGGIIDFPKPSVGATVNALLLAASARGETVIRGYAREPHIDSLIDYLVSAGADIRRLDGEICIAGRELHGGSAVIPGDMIETGTYLALAAVTGGEITVKGCPAEQISVPAVALRSIGAEIEESLGEISARRGMHPKYAEICAEPYPGFPTDLQPIMAAAMAASLGGAIRDNVWQTRFGYLESLSHFGIKSRVNGNRAVIYPSKIVPAEVKAPDLRGGMACVMAALCADGESVITSAQTVERGYEELEKKLLALGACVRIVE